MVTDALIDVSKHVGNLKFKVWKRMMDSVKYCECITVSIPETFNQAMS